MANPKLLKWMQIASVLSWSKFGETKNNTGKNKFTVCYEDDQWASEINFY